MKLFETIPSYHLFIDLDGVLADFKTGMERAMTKVFGRPHVHSEITYEQDPEYRKTMWKALHQYQTEHNGELWYELDLLPDALELWNYAKRFNPTILTATGDPKHGAPEQKKRWVREKFGSHVPVLTTRRLDGKAAHACENCILIDDKEKAIIPWEQNGGIGILHTSAKNTIRQLHKYFGPNR